MKQLKKEKKLSTCFCRARPLRSSSRKRRRPVELRRRVSVAEVQFAPNARDTDIHFGIPTHHIQQRQIKINENSKISKKKKRNY